MMIYSSAVHVCKAHTEKPCVLEQHRDSSQPSSTSSQHKDAPHLDAQYAGFGMVTEGIDVVDKIASVKTCSYGWYDDVPKVPVVIEKAEIIE